MAFFRERLKLKERKTVVGAFRNNTLRQDIYRERYWDPHTEMRMCVDAYNYNSLYQASINTMTKFVIGNELIVRSDDEMTQDFLQKKIDDLKLKLHMSEVIENTIKTGNGYLEMEWADDVVVKIYPVFDSSRMYINCDRYGEPLLINGVPNVEEYYLQRVDYNDDNPEARDYEISYYFGGNYSQLPIRAVPIPLDQMLHFKINCGETGIYGRSHIAATLNDYEMLSEMERSVAVNAKYKAVPKKIISIGSEELPVTQDEAEDFAQYMENLRREENAIINKPFKMEDLSYSGQEMNLQYAMEHVRHKMTTGVAPEFIMGFEKRTNKATAQMEIQAYILSIKSDREIFIAQLEEYILKPLIEKYGLKNAWLEFGELDFEDQNVKGNRVIQEWNSNLITLNEAREVLGLPARPDGEKLRQEMQAPSPQGMPADFMSGIKDGPVNVPDKPINIPDKPVNLPPKPISQPIPELKPTRMVDNEEPSLVDKYLSRKTKPVKKSEPFHLERDFVKESFKEKMATSKTAFSLDKEYSLKESYAAAIDKHPEKKRIAEYANAIVKVYKEARDALLVQIKKKGYTEAVVTFMEAKSAPDFNLIKGEGDDSFELEISKELSKKLKPVVQEYIKGTYVAAAKTASQHTYSNTFPDTAELIDSIDTNDSVNKIIDHNIKTIDDFTKEKLNKSLKELLTKSVHEGWSVGKTGEAISRLFQVSAWKGIQIAQSELNKAYSDATFDVIKLAQNKGGKKEGYYWWNINPTASKSGTCPICMGIWEKCKQQNGFSITNKNSPKPVINSHVNCFCFVTPYRREK